MTLQEFESRLKGMQEQINHLKAELKSFKSPVNTYSAPTEDTYILATKLMHGMQLPANLLGYYYVRTAIVLIYQDRSLLQKVTKELYPSIAKEHKTTANKVERAIRHAIETTWTKSPLRDVEHVFGKRVYEDKPTNSEFLAIIVDYLSVNNGRLLVSRRG